MAKLIHCITCAKNYAQMALRTEEVYECIGGLARKEMLCDGCMYKNYIRIGEPCYAAVLLPDREHFNYQHDKPSQWMDDFITSKTT